LIDHQGLEKVGLFGRSGARRGRVRSDRRRDDRGRIGHDGRRDRWGGDGWWLRRNHHDGRLRRVHRWYRRFDGGLRRGGRPRVNGRRLYDKRIRVITGKGRDVGGKLLHQSLADRETCIGPEHLYRIPLGRDIAADETGSEGSTGKIRIPCDHKLVGSSWSRATYVEAEEGSLLLHVTSFNHNPTWITSFRI
jgi:hypothetical protein